MRSVAIENPVENISVSTTRRAPPVAALRDHRREVREVRVGLLPHDVVLDRRDSHDRAAPASRATASSMTSGRLQHAKRTSGAPAVLVVVEHDARDGDHAAALRQRAAEREAVVVAERPDVGGDEVGAGGHEHVEAGSGEPGAQPVALVAHVGARTRRSSRRPRPSPTAIAYWNGPAFT